MYITIVMCSFNNYTTFIYSFIPPYTQSIYMHVYTSICVQSNGALELLNFDAVNMGQTHFINNDFFPFFFIII